MKQNAKPARHRGCALSRASCNGGTACSIECFNARQKIEHELYLSLRDLASFQVDAIFYDLTSTYFEGKGPMALGANGHSRDLRPRNPQVLVGLVLINGWPIAHHVFPGNWRDANT